MNSEAMVEKPWPFFMINFGRCVMKRDAEQYNTAHGGTGKQNHLDIDRIAFVGRTFDEYIRLFALDEKMLKQEKILDCPSGPSSFAAEAAGRGLDVTACDSAYDRTVDELAAKGMEDIDHVFDKFDRVSHQYVWKYYRDKDDVLSHRKTALHAFIRDFPSGYREGRYRHGKLPCLPFPDSCFSLVLSSHFLFLYGDRLEYDFHIKCLKELIRVCSGEIRIYPLTGLDAGPYPHLDTIMTFLGQNEINTDVVRIPFAFQRGSNRMMRITMSNGGRHDWIQ
jgi:hypothetical protein